MNQVLDYAPPPRLRNHAIAFTSAGTLAICCGLYFIACLPGMNRGVSAINPYLDGLAFTWICAIPFTAIFQPSGASRACMLILYAIATAPIFALSCDRGNPAMSGTSIMIGSLILLIPIHLVAALIVEGACRLIEKIFFRHFNALSRRTHLRLATASALAFTAFLPYTYVLWVNHEGRSRADAVWDSHDAYLICATARDFSDHHGITGTFNYDDATGLSLYPTYVFTESWQPPYSARLAQLLKVHGRPAWAAPHLPSQAEVIAIFESQNFTEIKAFPHVPTPDYRNL